MAIDTNTEKLALMEWDLVWEPAIPLSPGATFGQDDKQQLLWGYPGILWGEVVGDLLLYWTENGGTNRVARSDLLGAGTEQIDPSPNALFIDIDEDASRVVWSDSGVVSVDLFIADLDGSNKSNLVSELGGGADGVAVDPAPQHIYFVAGTDIRRIDYDGSNDTTFITGLPEPLATANPLDLVVDEVNQQLWISDNNNDAIYSAPLSDGSAVALAFSTNNPRGIDLVDDWVYWVDGDALSVKRAKRDGTMVEELVTGFTFPISVRVNAGLMYISDTGTDEIYTADAEDGSGLTAIHTGLSNPFGIAIAAARVITEIVVEEEEEAVRRSPFLGDVRMRRPVRRDFLEEDDAEALAIILLLALQPASVTVVNRVLRMATEPEATIPKASALVNRLEAEANRLGAEFRRRLVSRLSRRHLSLSDAVNVAREVFQEFAVAEEALLSEAIVAGWLSGAEDVARELPKSARTTLLEARAVGTAIDIAQPPGPPQGPILGPDGTPGRRFPAIEAARRNLESRTVLERADFDRASGQARAEAFTVARKSEGAIDQIRGVLAELVEDGASLGEFRRRLEEAAIESPLGPGHVENVYRTNIQTAFARGQDEVLNHPLVSDEFPYVAYEAIGGKRGDGRNREEHTAMMTLGIQGTNVYRRDDPVIQRFRPPWDYNCRCGLVPLTLEDAAARGINEAIEWLRTGQPPLRPAHVPFPPFDIPVGFRR